MLVLDTHALIWAHMGIRIPKKIAKRIKAAGQDNQLFIFRDHAMGDRARSAIPSISLGTMPILPTASSSQTARRLGASLVTADTAILAFARSTKAVRVLEL